VSGRRRPVPSAWIARRSTDWCDVSAC